MNRWRTRTVGDLVALQRGIDLPATVRQPGDVPVMGSFGVTGWHNEAACRGPGVTIGRSGASVGAVSFIERDYWPLNTCLFVRDFKGNDPRFAYYFLKTLDLAGLNSGSAQPSLNRNFVHPLPATFPEYPEQVAIGSTLGALDDKIALNQRMIETLEMMAQVIFRDWFVDFGPARRKLAGERDPVAIMGGLAPDQAHSVALAALFSDQIENGIPKGWRPQPFGEFFRLERGLSYKGNGLSDTGTPLINLGCFQGRGRFNRENIKRYTGEYRERHCVAPGVLLIANTDITQNRIVIGSPFVVPEGEDWDRAIYSHHIYAARPLEANSARWTRYFYFHLLQPEFRSRAEGFATGTTVLALPKDAVEASIFVIPPDPLHRAFLELVEPLLLLVQQAENESRLLAETRDYLLPRLMSGKVRVADAEVEVAA